LYLYQTNIRKTDWNNLKQIFPKAVLDSGGYNVPLFSDDTVIVKSPPVKK
jgi:hypothetical protein